VWAGIIVVSSVTVLAPPVSPSASNSTCPASRPTSIRPEPNADHVPKPSRVEGFVETAEMKMEPTGQQAETLPGGP
jgi:hypothetical protein